MSILDKASLIQIPSGYKSTKLYSLRPINGDGDFTFARSSSATRVNSEGLIETASVLGSEEVTNGDFATDTDWTKGVGWTISGGTANSDNSGSGTRNLRQDDILEVGKTYEIKFDLNITSGTLYLIFGGTLGLSQSQSYTLTRTSTSTDLVFRNSIGNFVGSIDNVSVKEVIENDVPRLDYSGGASCASLLLESQRTNLISYSESFDNADWAKEDLSVSANATTSPDGTTNADLLLPNTNNTDHSIYDTTPSGVAAFSVFLKAGGYNYAFLGNNNNVATDGAFFDLANGVVSQNTSTLSASIEDYGNGWYRCSLFGSFSNIYRIICTSENGTSFIHSGDGVKGVYIYGAQVEQGSYPTSYIISNSGSQTTRTADVCNNAGTSATFNDSEGVLFAEIAALTDVGDGTTRLSISDATQDNNITIGYSATNTLRTIIRSGASNQALMTSSQTITNYLKVGVKYKANDFALWVNGVEVATDTSGLAPVGLSELSFDRGDATLPFYGKTKQLIYFDEALSDEELSDLTGQVNLSFNNLATFYGYTIL